MQHRHPDSDPAARWSVADLIDFEHYLDTDERTLRDDPAARRALTDRDRTLYLEGIAAAAGPARVHTPEHRRRTLRLWLRARREAETPEHQELLPGAAFARAQRWVVGALALTGLLLGLGVAAALLHYDGQRPVNVSWYLFLLVLVQFLLIGGALAAWLLRRTRLVGTALRDVTLFGGLIRGLFVGLARRIQRHRLRQAGQALRDRVQAGQGLLQARYTLYGPLAYLPVLVPAQGFGVAFNVGVVLATLALEGFTDLAFGWGSALDIGPRAVHGLAQTMALPWSWLFGEGVGYPTLEQVAGSRISLKDPLFLQDAGDLRSWGWFLVLAVFSYGLLPRVLLLSASRLARRRALERLPFTHGRTQALYARLVTPRLETAGGASGQGPEMPIPAPVVPRRPLPGPAPATGGTLQRTPPEPIPQSAPQPPPEPTPQPPPEPTPEPAPVPQPAPAPTPPRPAGIAADACLLLVHVDVDDLLEPPDRERLAGLLRGHAGWRVAGATAFGTGRAVTDPVVAWVAEQHWEAPPARVAVLMDGSQPPITEHLRFLRELRGAAGTQAQLLLALVGDPEDEDPLPPLSDFDFSDWRRKVEQLADPYLRLEMLVPANPEEHA
jgi:hypothetical protein